MRETYRGMVIDDVSKKRPTKTTACQIENNLSKRSENILYHNYIILFSSVKKRNPKVLHRYRDGWNMLWVHVHSVSLVAPLARHGQQWGGHPASPYPVACRHDYTQHFHQATRGCQMPVLQLVTGGELGLKSWSSLARWESREGWVGAAGGSPVPKVYGFVPK